MPDADDPFPDWPETERLSETDAAGVWRRAAELQTADADRSATSYPVRDVAAAAAEAGIARRYVDQALAERAADAPRPFTGRSPAAGNALLGSARPMSVHRRVEAPPRRVLDVLGRVLQAPPFGLLLGDAVGDARDGGVLAFRLPTITSESDARMAWANLRFGVGARALRVTLRPAAAADGTPDGACEVTLSADPPDSLGGQLAGALFFDGMMGAGGAGIGWMVGVKLAVAGAVMASWMTGLGVLGTAAGVAWYRSMYQASFAKSEAEMTRAVEAIEAGLRSLALFGELPAPRPARRADDDPTFLLGS